MKQIFITSGLFLLLLLSAFQQGFAQNNQELIQQFLNENREKLELSPKDISDWIITDQYSSEQSDITHIYIRQRHQNIEVYNGVANFNIREGKIISMGDRLQRNMATRANTTTPDLTPMQAIQKAAEQLNLTITEELRALEPLSMQHFVFNNAGISKENIPVKLMYQPGPEGELFLAWDVTIYQKNGQHWWSLRLNAQSGQIIDKTDWVLHCSFPDGAFGNCNNPTHHHTAAPAPNAPTTTQNTTLLPDQYRVFAIPLESPNHGSRTLEVDPKDSLASPYGWHDTNGATGAEFTITRGNNVHAYEDVNDNDVPGYSPNGGAALNFDFPLNLNQAPSGYFDPAITNLFYWNNIMHDVWYRYGFTEAAGNFQQNNYGRGGLGTDYVQAEAQDGGGTNNANFATPEDGDNPRMQMYLWTNGGGAANLLTVNSPIGVAGAYSATEATFGPGVPATPITADLVLVIDNTAPTNDGCDPLTNAGALSGKIAVVYRGNCNFTVKVAEAQAAGAAAVIVINNAAGAPINMGGTDPTITIPSIMISDVNGAAIATAMGSGTVNATIVNNTGNFNIDGDFDNGIIAHEYGHGISNRLTGGPAAAGCLGNAEQMGEGWSDFFGLMLTIEPGDLATDIRGIGTFATGTATTSTGIRNAPYTTNTAVNSYTYGDVNNTGNVSQPHGIGFVWCTMLWDLNWAMIGQYGFDTNFYTGTGGNNMTMHLVMEGLKLQPCSPGFVDGRDAILLADQQLYGGANQCLIWEVFAARGLGYSASQGLSTSRSDQVEAFDLPPSCQIPTAAPVAAFSSALLSSCSGTVNFTDASTSIPQSWNWNFGDGNSSTVQNPTHIYTASGTYTVTLTASNTIGSNTTTQTVTVSLPAPPVVSGASICSGQSATLSGTVPGGNTIIWYDASGNTPLDTASFYTTPALSANTTYMAENVQFFPSQNVGPIGGGAGGYHGNAQAFYINFEAFKAFTLVSVWVDANSTGVRTIELRDAYNGGGNVVTTITPNIPAGQGRVQLNIAIPGPGLYSIGLANANMFRNNAGITYPFAISGMVSLNSSSAGTPGFYYYLYDWEVQEAPCRSAQVPVAVGVNGANFSTVSNGLAVQFTDLSVGASTWAWDFGDGNTSTAQNPNHSYAAQGTYTVTLTVNGNTTCPYTSVITLMTTDIVSTGDLPLEVSLMPNPAKGQSSISFGKVLTEDMQIQIISVDGRVLQELTVRAGETTKTLDLSKLVPAMYLVRVNSTSATHTLKLTVE